MKQRSLFINNLWIPQLQTPTFTEQRVSGINSQVDAWVDNVENYDSLFRRLAATLGRLRELAGSLGRSWLHGHAGARRLYTQHA
jgi:hypothetical protein